MDFDQNKIKKEIVIIDGKEVPLYKIPAGMRGNVETITPTLKSKDKVVEEEILIEDHTDDKEDVVEYYNNNHGYEEINMAYHMPEHNAFSNLFDKI